jgi:hypothetical protein
MNVAPYSIVSYAWGQKYQQSNQWAVETLAAAMEPGTVGNRAQAQAWMQFKGYEPTTLQARSADPPGRARQLGQHCLRRPPERQAFL